ncbi:MAG: CDP-diacylglycerol--glycerol-3-phosphate 3-phosphatidyltransferase [Verrucomicrobiota bacterium]
MNLPNRLTVLRLVLTVVFVAVTAFSWPFAWTTGLVIFLVASYTDYLDGAIARKRNLITNFGKLMDPLADKVLVAAALVALVAASEVAAWIVVLILSREFLVTGMRLVAAGEGKVVSADKFGKLKTILQMVAIIGFLAYLAIIEFGTILPALRLVSEIVLYAALVITCVSGFRYLRANWEVFEDA